jgi:hypothetical protein
MAISLQFYPKPKLEQAKIYLLKSIILYQVGW